MEQGQQDGHMVPVVSMRSLLSGSMVSQVHERRVGVVGDGVPLGRRWMRSDILRGGGVKRLPMGVAVSDSLELVLGGYMGPVGQPWSWVGDGKGGSCRGLWADGTCMASATWIWLAGR